MPVWQRIYEELNDPDFVIISAAQDTGGEAVAGPIFDDARATYIQVVDTNHVISSAFNFVNVPAAAWIDESGRVVRIDEGTYAKKHPFGGNDVYAPALVDWVKNGDASRFVQSADKVTSKIRQRSPDEEKAEPAFRLGNYFREHGQTEKAEHFWAMAKRLNPDSVNFFRQDLTLSAEGSAGQSFLGFVKRYIDEGKQYYRPLDLDDN